MEKNTYKELECKSGKRIQLTLSFYRMYQLKNKNKEAYEKCSQIMCRGTKDIMENAQIVYTAYLCANIENADKCMGYEEFLQELPDDWGSVCAMAQELVGVKKKGTSGKLS